MFFKPNVEKMHLKGDVNGLIKALNYEKDYEVKRKAITAIGDLSDYRDLQDLSDIDFQRAVEPLCSILENDKRRTIIIETILTLTSIVDVRSIKPLCNLLKNNYDKEVYEKVGEALVKIGKTSVEPLCEVLKDSNFPEARSKAAEILIKIGDPLAFEALCAALSDSDYNIRSSAAVGLGKLNSIQAIEPLCNALSDPNDNVRKVAAKALNKIKNFNARKLDRKLLILYKIASGEKIGEYGQEAMELLCDGVKYGDYSLQKELAPKLRTLGLPEDRKSDRKLMTNYYIALQSWDKVSNFGEEAIAPLCEALQDSWDEEVKYNVENLLAKAGKAAVEPLCKLLKDSDGYKRIGAANVLGAIGDTRAIDALVSAASDIGTAAVHALLMIGGDSAKEALKSLSRHDYYELRVFADEALDIIELLGDPKKIDSLIRVLRNYDSQTVIAIINKIVYLGGDYARKALREFSRNGANEEIRLAAKNALDKMQNN